MNIKGGLIFFVLAALCLPGFFFASNCSAAGRVSIREVAWAGSLESSYDEWVELVNDSEQIVSLEGWSLKARDGSPEVSLSGSVPAGGVFLLERTDDGSSPAVADMFYSGSLGNDGEYLELRDGSGAVIDFLDASSGWTGGDNSSKSTLQRCGDIWSSSPLPGGTPKAINDCRSTLEDNSVVSVGEEVHRFGDLVVNEFVSDPETGDSEWVELYHRDGSALNLEGWYVSDGAGSKTSLTGSLVSGERFFVIYEIKGALNNSGDRISVFSPDGNLIDSVPYGDWGSSTESNAPAPSKGASCASVVDGQRLSYLSDSFALSSESTPGRGNKVVSLRLEVESPSSMTLRVRISEVFTDPRGSDREDEFIEFYNDSDVDVDLMGWRLTIEGGKALEFGKNFLLAPKIAPGSFFVLWRKDSLAALDNDSGSLRLFAPGAKSPLQVVDYPVLDEGWAWADVSLVGSSTSSSTKRFLVNSLSLEPWATTKMPTPGGYNEIWSDNRPPRVEFALPKISASGTVLTFDASDSVDEDGDELSFVWDFGDGIRVEGETVAHIFYEDGSFPVRLIANDGRVDSSLERVLRIGSVAPVVTSSTSLRPASSVQGDVDGYSWPLSESFLSSTKDPSSIPMPLSDIEKVKLGDLVEVSGRVVVVPGSFGKQFFYIIASSGPALKVYDYDSDFPVLALGDVVSARGVISGSRERYVKIGGRSDISLFSSGDPIVPESVDRQLEDDDLLRFVSLSGRIEKSEGRVVLVSDFGRVRIALKGGSGLLPSDFEDGEPIEVSGLVVEASSELAIAPRGHFDVLSKTDYLKESSSSTSKVESSDEVVGDVGRDWVLPTHQSSNRSLLYVLLAVSALAIFLGYSLFKERRRDDRSL